VVNSYNNLRPI